MLYLTHPAQATNQGAKRVALAERTAVRLERALLAATDAARRLELQTALAQDEAFSGWALRAAEHRLNRTVNRAEEAAAWLESSLEAELAASLVVAPELSDSSSAEIEWRLPALVAKLHAYREQLESFDARLEHAKLESLKELAYGASHEINNPLANIAARAQTLLADEADPERARKLQAIHRQAMRAHEMIADLMLFARPPKLSIAPFDLHALVAQIVAELRELAQAGDVELVTTVGNAPLEVAADRTQLGVAIRAVAQNAIEAVGPGGHVELSATSVEDSSGQFADIVVRDDGPGVSAEVREHLFDPFFSGREAGRGLGFGLSKAWRIVTDHGGTIVVRQPALRGAEFVIRVPL